MVQQTSNEIKTDEKQESTQVSVNQATLDRVEKLKQATPNWKKKLGTTLLALSIPVLGLAFDSAGRYDSYRAGDPSIAPDLPSVEHDLNPKENPYAEAAIKKVEPFPSLVVMSDSYPSLTRSLEVQEGQTVSDIFKVELARSLFPELKVDTASFTDPAISQKITDGIEKYQQNNSEIYNAAYSKYLKGVQNLNPDVAIAAGQPLSPNRPIVSLSTSPIIEEIQLRNLLKPLK